MIRYDVRVGQGVRGWLRLLLALVLLAGCEGRRCASLRLDYEWPERYATILSATPRVDGSTELRVRYERLVNAAGETTREPWTVTRIVGTYTCVERE